MNVVTPLKISLKSVGVVLLNKAINISEISVDKLKESSGFDNILVQPNSILLNKNNASCILQPNRVEFTFPTPTENNTIIEKIEKLLTVVPKIICVAIGTNYSCEILISDCNNAGQFIKENFLKNVENIEKYFDKKVISNSTRIFLGTPEHHYDMRLFPINLLNSPNIGCHFHVHSENKDGIQNVIEDIKKRLNKEFDDFQNRLNNLLQDCE